MIIGGGRNIKGVAVKPKGHERRTSNVDVSSTLSIFMWLASYPLDLYIFPIPEGGL